MKVFFKIAWRNVFRNWRRSLLTLLVIAVGLAGLIFTWALADGSAEQSIGNYTDYLTGHVQIQKKGFQKEMSIFLALDNPREVIAKISQDPEIKNFTERIAGRAFISLGEKSAGMVLVGVDPSSEVRVVNMWKAVIAGRYLEPKDRAAMVLGKAMSIRLGANLGDKVAVITQAADGSLGAASYKVVGIYNTGSGAFEGTYAFVTLPAARDLFALEGRSTAIVIKAENLKAVSYLKSSLQARFDPQKVEVLDWGQIIPELLRSIKVREAVANLVLLNVFLIVASGILNTILMAVVERRREFGILMALGTRGYQIVVMVIMESVLLGMFGVLSGSALGGAVVLILDMTGFDLSRFAKYLGTGTPAIPSIIYPIITIERLFILAAMVLVVAVLAAFYPAVKAAALKPAPAIRQMETI